MLNFTRRSVVNMLSIRLIAIVFSSFLCVEINADRVRYDNYNIYKVVPKWNRHLRILRNLEVSSDGLIYFDPVVEVDKSINILVAPEKQKDFYRQLNDEEIFYELAEENFQRTLDAEIAEFNTRSSVYDWTGYHTLNETHEWLRSVARNYPSNVQTIVAGKSFEGREILGVKLSYKSGNKGIFIEGNIHAREWISPATVTYLLNELLTSKDPAVRAMAQKYDWYIFPHVNPDGFVYTHTTDRLWRKTRSPGTECYGADPNRNWGFHWMEIGASDQECSGTYGGKSAFSEIETKSLSEYIASLKGKIHTYLAFHSFSQLMLFPYGHTADPCPHDEDLAQIARAASTALSKRYGTQYKYGSTYKAIYPAAGSSVDWVYGTQDVPVAYTYELRPSNSVNGFVLPSAQIIPTAQETLDSLVALTAECAKLGYL